MFSENYSNIQVRNLQRFLLTDLSLEVLRNLWRAAPLLYPMIFSFPTRFIPKYLLNFKMQAAPTGLLKIVRDILLVLPLINPARLLSTDLSVEILRNQGKLLPGGLYPSIITILGDSSLRISLVTRTLRTRGGPLIRLPRDILTTCLGKARDPQNPQRFLPKVYPQ